VQNKQHVALRDGNALSVQGLEVNLFKQGHEIGFSSVLEGGDGSRLEADIRL